MAENPDVNVNEMRSRLLAAEAKIAELEARNNNDWLTESRTEQIRGLVHDVLADADTRASLLQSGTNVGYDNGAMIGSADGNWMLKTNLLMQQRFIYNMADDGAGGIDQDENRYGFENTRTKFILTGHVVNPDWTYRVDINVAANGNPREGVTNAYLGYNYGDGWMVKMGSMKNPLLREEQVEAQHQLAADRSVANYYSGAAGYIDGVAFTKMNDTWRGTFSFNDGAGSGQSAALAIDTEWAFTVRGEWLMSGTWDQFDDFTSPPGGEHGVMIGAGIHWQKGEYGEDTVNASGSDELETMIFTIDGSMEWGGANALIAFTYADMDDDTTGGVDMSPWTLVLQGGYYMNDDWEIFARYETGDADEPSGSSYEDLGVFTIGVNRYYAGHNAKWTTDLSFGTEEFDATAGDPFGAPNALTGFRTDDTREDGQIVLRSQFQILF